MQSLCGCPPSSAVVLSLPERDEVELEAGVTDIVYTPTTDFRRLYSWNSLLDDCTDDPRARELLRVLLVAYGMAMSGDLESLGLSFREMKSMPWFGFAPEDVDRLAEKLFELKAI